jgi:NADPH-dependent 2,4-dienoyl-CoA reductase/sulfur reductase-like enzyme
MSKKVIIIGGSAAGPKAASKIRRLDQEADITIIQKGKYLSMASCGYPYFVGGVFDDRNKLIATPTGVVRDSTFFSNVKAIKALVNTEVTKINRETKTIKAVDIETKKESTLEYDKLILTIGANPIFPDFPGKELENITTLQSMEDADFLKQFAIEKNISMR